MSDVTTVRDIADGVRSGSTSATAVVERHLTAIAEREPEINAFNHVATEEICPSGDSM